MSLLSNVNFTSSKNYLKQLVAASETMAKPATLDGTSGVYYTTKTITHNLGYVPLVRAWYDKDGNDTLYPTNGQYGGQTSGDFTWAYYFFIDSITTTAVTFRAEANILPTAGNFTFYYRIYYDFGQ